MKRRIHISILTILLFANSYAQSSLWNKVSDEKIKSIPKMERASTPSKYELFSLDFSALKSQLQSAPLDSSGINSNLIISFPNPEGQLDNYKIYEAPVMEAELANKYQGNKSYIGKGIEDPTATIRFSVTLFGLHTMTLSGKTGTAFIDTYTKDLKNYIVYSKSNISASRSFQCLVKETNPFADKNPNKIDLNTAKFSDGKFRIFRLAMACTIEYAAFHVNAAGVGSGTLAEKKAAVLAAMGVTMTRVNGVYERDLSMRLTLIGNNDLVIFIDSDNFTNDDAGALINESQSQITSIIGNANFDIGHTVSTGGGGLAGPSPCVNGQKASGITGSPAPVGDPYDIDYVAHEMGHQFGANHTFNNSCGGNRNNSTAVEPGSGSTIMAYAGICSPNVQNNSDAHFHAVSIAEINALVLSSATCANTTNNNNNAPVVNAGLDYTIPKSTPFILTGNSTDADGDTLTYCWEQTNTETSTQPPTATATVGPNFRSNPPIASPERYMPKLSTVLAGNTSNTWEVCSSAARTMNFALTVRDNKSPNGGQTGRDDMIVTTSGAAGPFKVNVPNTAITWTAGTNETVTWDVAGTTGNGVNTPFVDVFLSTDGGFTYPIQLANKIPNNGSTTVTVPNNVGTTNRIMVSGYQNIFYDISNANFSIVAPATTFSVSQSSEQTILGCTPASAAYTFDYFPLGGFTGTTTFSASGQPAGATVDFSPVSMSDILGTVNMTVNGLTGAAGGNYNIVMTATDGTKTMTVPFYLYIGLPDATLTTPADLTTGTANSVSLNWIASVGATSYDVEVATDAAFTSIISTGNVATTSYIVSGLADTTDYYWRVKPKSATCTGNFSTAFKFTTGTTVCNTDSSTNVPVTIAAASPNTITSTLNIPSGGTLSDVNITIDITHTWINDLSATLTSPTGTIVSLFANKCDSGSSINDITATFDDAGVAIVCGNSPGISGTVLPAQPLSAFNGESSTGTWTLTVTDGFAQDGGTLNGWSLNTCTATLAVAQNMLSNFVLYPNPNKGNFTVQFDSKSNSAIAISVHDITGRMIMNRKYNNTGLISQNVSLENVQTGIYLVTVQDGDNKVVKRIVVE